MKLTGPSPRNRLVTNRSQPPQSTSLVEVMVLRYVVLVGPRSKPALVLKVLVQGVGSS